MKNDYRNTIYCTVLENVDEKKKALKEKIQEEHPRVKIIYNQVKDRKGDYKSPFMEIYNYKCGYCGNSILNIGANLLEVDHYICESSFASKEEAGKIENLVLACYDCNRSKLDLTMADEYIDMLNPDCDKIRNVFNRDDLYYIKISEEFEEDAFVKRFHEQLKLGYQTKRLDFLLMSIRGLCNELEGNPKLGELNSILIKLQEKRNITICK